MTPKNYGSNRVFGEVSKIVTEKDANFFISFSYKNPIEKNSLDTKELASRKSVLISDIEDFLSIANPNNRPYHIMAVALEYWLSQKSGELLEELLKIQNENRKNSRIHNQRELIFRELCNYCALTYGLSLSIVDKVLSRYNRKVIIAGFKPSFLRCVTGKTPEYMMMIRTQLGYVQYYTKKPDKERLLVEAVEEINKFKAEKEAHQEKIARQQLIEMLN